LKGRIAEVEKQLASQRKIQKGLQNVLEVSAGAQKKDATKAIRESEEKTENLEGELRVLQSRLEKMQVKE